MDIVDQIVNAEERLAELGPAREMTPQDFQEVFEHARAMGLGQLAQHGRVEAAVLLPGYGPQGLAQVGVLPVEPLMADERGKDLVAMAIDKLILDPNHDFAILLHEGWALRGPQGDARAEEEIGRARGTDFSASPKRSEALVVSIRSKTAQAVGVVFFTRAPDGALAGIEAPELVFGESAGAGIEGRFAAGAPSRRAGATLH